VSGGHCFAHPVMGTFLAHVCHNRGTFSYMIFNIKMRHLSVRNPIPDRIDAFFDEKIIDKSHQDLARNILYIMVMWLIYFISCEITYNRLGLRITADISKLSKTDIGAEYANQLSERYMSQAHSFYGYAFFIILSFSLYLAGKLVREIDSSNTFHKVLYIILISISPVLMIIGLTNERGFDSLMPLFSVIMAAVTLLVVIIFIRDWKKSDMRG